MVLRPTRQWSLVFTLSIAAALTLSGCVQTGGVTSTASATAVPSAEPDTPPGGPILRPGESAAANRQFFDLLNNEYFAANGRGAGRAIFDNLVANGFMKTDMELTPDTTTVGLEADSIVVSVRIEGECLLGQFTPENYVSAIEPVLGTGKCLVGNSRAIDW